MINENVITGQQILTNNILLVPVVSDIEFFKDG